MTLSAGLLHPDRLPRSFDFDPERLIGDQAVTLRDAVLVPAVRRLNFRVEAGLFDASGMVHPNALGWHYSKNAAQRLPEFPATVAQSRRGHFFFLGHHMDQFGHFLLETTARLWHLHMHPQNYDGCVLLHHPQANPAKMNEVLGRFFRLCDLPMPPILHVDRPTRLERVTVPMQGNGALDLMEGSPEYRGMIHARFARSIEPQGAERIYISRTGLGGTHGSLIEERKLEALLEAEGYVPFHPQNHGMEAQIAQYKAARMIVAVDGSALHLLALVCGPDQKVAVFQRRPAPEAQWQVRQLARYGAGHVEMIQAEPTGWSPAGVRRSALSVFGMTSFPKAAEQLARQGFIVRPERWLDTDRDVLRKQIRRLGRTLGRDMYEVTRSGESLSHLPARRDPSRIRLWALGQRQSYNDGG